MGFPFVGMGEQAAGGVAVKFTLMEVLGIGEEGDGAPLVMAVRRLLPARAALAIEAAAKADVREVAARALLWALTMLGLSDALLAIPLVRAVAVYCFWARVKVTP